MKRCRFPLFLIGEIHNCRKESGLSKRGVNVAAKKAEKNSAIQKKFYISQIETTKRIIKTFSETTEFSPAMLINSLLSLVILPYERAKESGGGRIFPGKYPDLIRKIGISPQIFTPIQSCSNGDVVYNRKTIYTFPSTFTLPDRVYIRETSFEGRSDAIEKCSLDEDVYLISSKADYDSMRLEVLSEHGSLGFLPSDVSDEIAPAFLSGHLEYSAKITELVPLSQRNKYAKSSIVGITLEAIFTENIVAKKLPSTLRQNETIVLEENK